ncbi:unnamed protein product [Timema podura]|uniref:Uncharacterized protein n=1 Tax=Timema podura TaxID=61482 RepID=A0ABN7NX43_TIMPD|nr:unnamed protein product [Timema podura]
MSFPRPEYFSPEPEFDWLQLRKDLDTSPIETPQEKLYRKFNENPLVPIVSAGSGLRYCISHK